MRPALVCTLLVAGAATAVPVAARGYAPTAPVADTLAWPAPRAYRHERLIATSRDSLAATVTTSMVVDKGRYLLWMQRPRVVLAAVRPDSLAAGSWPDVILVEFQTKSPQYTATNVLTLTTSGVEPLSAPATASRVRQRAFVNEHTLTFALPLADFLRTVHGDAVALEVGGVKVRLGGEQLEAMRDFAVRVHDSKPGAGI
jgi:hypothetical protein